MHKIYLKCDYKFNIEFIIDFFCNFNFIYVLKINKFDLTVLKINKSKEKDLDNIKIQNEQKLYEIIEDIRKKYNYKELIIIYGISIILNKISTDLKNIIIKKDFIGNNDLYLLYENNLMKKNHLLLENRLGDLTNEKTNTDLYVFGKLKFEIKNAIESYSIKELYIEDKKLDKLKSFIDNDYFNFKIIPIKVLEEGDIASNFIKNYNGIMGIKYY